MRWFHRAAGATAAGRINAMGYTQNRSVDGGGDAVRVIDNRVKLLKVKLLLISVLK